MKRTLALWLGVVAISLVPAFGQAPAGTQAQPMGKIHGQITNPTGAPQTAGTVTLSTDGGHTAKFSFPVNSAGQYSGEAAPGTYMAIYRQPDTPPDKMVDSFNNVKIVAGEDVLQDFDMTRKEFVDKLPEETRKQLEDMRKHNSEALKANEVIKHLNDDLHQVNEDQKDAGQAQQLAVQQLGASASKADIEAKEAEIKTAKFTDMEALMTKDTAAKPDASILWAQLGQAKLGLKKYDEAEADFKKAIDLEAAAKKQNPEIGGMAEAGLGEVYARTGKVPEANAAYAAAAKANPTKAGMYLRNQAVIFFQAGNGDAQVAAAQEAVKTSPDDAVLYYLIGQGLVQKATIDPKTQRIVLPPGCAEAYQKYLELAPNGPYSTDAKGILQQAGEKVSSSFKASKKK